MTRSPLADRIAEPRTLQFVIMEDDVFWHDAQSLAVTHNKHSRTLDAKTSCKRLHPPMKAFQPLDRDSLNNAVVVFFLWSPEFDYFKTS